MFQEFFGLREQPFGVTPDPRFLYLAPAHREALASLFYGIESNRGFLSLIARPGMGKTTLLFHLLEKFRNRARTAFLFQTQCSSREFMRLLLAEVGLEHDGRDFVQMHEIFNRLLLQTAREGRRFLVVIDEAQNLDPPVLETVRLLSDFETPRAKLLQIILAGQPELAEKLSHPGLSQLRQRITSFNGLKQLPVDQAARYIEHRLRVAGYEGPSLFDSEALGLIAEISEGIPRNINNLCFHALSIAFAVKQRVVDGSMVREVADDLDIRRLLTHEDAGGAHFGLDMDFHQEWDERSAPKGESRAHSAQPSLVQPNLVRTNASSERDLLSPDEAREHMQEVTRFLKNWQGMSRKRS